MTLADSQALLIGRTAVITGANRGIGETITRTFAAHGADIVACIRQPDDDDRTRLQALSNEYGINARTVALDLTDEASIKDAARTIVQGGARPDILVNNAGSASGSLFQMTTMAELRRLFEVNFFGQMLLTQGIARAMARAGRGSIINIASTAADVAAPGTLAYGASKAAMVRATLSLASELGASGIRANAISPGVTDTAMGAQMDPAARDALIARSALKRLATPQEIANVALFLASDLSAFVTGQVLRVDGGMV